MPNLKKGAKTGKCFYKIHFFHTLLQPTLGDLSYLNLCKIKLTSLSSNLPFSLYKLKWRSEIRRKSFCEARVLIMFIIFSVSTSKYSKLPVQPTQAGAWSSRGPDAWRTSPSSTSCSPPATPPTTTTTNAIRLFCPGVSIKI